MRIACIDPGGTTGIAVFVVEPGDVRLEGTLATKSYSTIFHFLSALIKGELDHIVCEQFRLLPSHAADLSYSTFPSSEVIGILKLLNELLEIPLTFQNPGDRSFFDDISKLKALGYYDSNVHVRDAIMHGLTFLSKDPKLEQYFVNKLTSLLD